jgi:hypothetical protein
MKSHKWKAQLRINAEARSSFVAFEIKEGATPTSTVKPLKRMYPWPSPHRRQNRIVAAAGKSSRRIGAIAALFEEAAEAEAITESS